MDLYAAIVSLSERIEDEDIIDNEAVEGILAMIDNGGKDLLLSYENKSTSILIEAMNLNVPVEIIFKMIEVGDKELVMRTDHYDHTSLHIVFEYEAVADVISKLLDVGGRDLVMVGNELYGKTALHYACQVNPRENHDEAMAKLIEFGGKELVIAKDYSGDTVLHYANYHSMSLEIVKKMIEIGGKDLLKEENDDHMMAVYLVFSESELDETEIIDLLILLIKEGIYHNIGNDEFSIGGLFERYQEEVVFGNLWDTRLLPVLKEVYRQIQLEAPNMTPPLLHAMIWIMAPTDIILDVLKNFVGIASIKDTKGRYAIDFAIQMRRALEPGMIAILQATAKPNGWSILHCAAYHGLPWNKGMDELVEANMDKAVNGVNEKTGLKLFMTAAIGGNLDTIYSLIRMDPMKMFL